MASFEGKVVIITGGALGIGQATAWEFAREGSMVAVADVNREAGDATVAEVERLGGKGLMLEADVSDSSDCRRVVEAAVERFGGVDILFNNVGIQPPASYTNVEDTSEDMWDRIIGVNLKSCFLMSKYSLPRNAQARRRRHHQHRQRAGPAVTAARASLRCEQGGHTLAHAPDVARLCQGQHPRAGSLPWQHRHAHATGCGGSGRRRPGRGREHVGAAHPIGRVGTGQDIANAVLFLASDKASFMTGENVNVDGGYMALGAWATAARD